MDKGKLEKANELNSIIESYSNDINGYCDSMNYNYTFLGSALRSIDNLDPKYSVDIKKAIRKALDSIQKEFDEL